MNKRYKPTNNKLTAGPVILAVVILAACYLLLLRGPMSTHSSLESKLKGTGTATTVQASNATLHAAAAALPSVPSRPAAQRDVTAIAHRDGVKATSRGQGDVLSVSATGSQAGLIKFLADLTSQVKLVGNQIQGADQLYQASNVTLTGGHLSFSLTIS